MLGDVGDSLREAFFMFWETLWALVLGFGLSGAVQAFVSKDADAAGAGRPPAAGAVARASGFGMVSSSCSYAATAMAKSLFQKGADFVTAMVFMFASTNLVVELGVVLIVLMGWQFARAEFVGGPIMIVLLAFTGGSSAGRVGRAGAGTAAARLVGGHDHQAMVGVSDERAGRARAHAVAAKLTSKAAWADAASYTIADITMLRRELVIGYVVAGFLTVLVPMHVWNDVFLHGHGFWTTLENVVVGPFIAVISFVCSIGNVPMAAALWHGGISFGGVISFIFADLITLPLLLIYRKYYGTGSRCGCSHLLVRDVDGRQSSIGRRHLPVFGAIPTNRPETVVPERFAWNYTSFLNIAFLVVLVVVVVLARRRRSDPDAGRYATDPTCGMQVDKRTRRRISFTPAAMSGSAAMDAGPATRNRTGWVPHKLGSLVAR